MYVQVKIKTFSVDMEVKNNGVEFEVKDNAGNHLGDCYATKTGLIWCAGRQRRENGKRISWDEFAALMAARP